MHVYVANCAQLTQAAALAAEYGFAWCFAGAQIRVWPEV